MKPALCTANWVAREADYAIRPFQWMEAERITREHFHSDPHTLATKFEELIGICAGLGVDAVDLWYAQLDPWRVDPLMVERAVESLRRHNMTVVSYSAGMGGPPSSREAALVSVRVAQQIGAPRFGVGLHPSNEALAVEVCRAFDLRYGIENHPENSAQALKERLEAIPGNLQDGTPGYVGVTCDTGWWATQGVDPVEAVYTLRDHLLHIHLKDVTHAGLPHETCTLGDGIVDVPGVLRALAAVGYDGTVAIEHEPEYHDPLEDLRISIDRVRAWLKAL